MILKPSYDVADKAYLAVDCIIFGFDPNLEELQILLIRRNFEPMKGHWSLMGGFLRKDEHLDQAAERVLFQLTGLHHIYMEQFSVFSDPQRDPADRTVSVTYYALINVTDHGSPITDKHDACWFNLSELPDLIFDHREMVQQAMRRLQYKTSIQPIGFELLPDKFTMRHLQKLYEAILCRPLDKRNFTKKIHTLDILVRLNKKDMESSRKGSFLYQFDEEKYLSKVSEGFVFRI